MYELGRRSSKQATGTPIKKLLAEEMSRDAEFKKKSPGVIARLMGFDGLPPHQLSHKQPKSSSHNYVQRAAISEKSQKSSTSCSRRSSRKSSKEEQEFKDVFEVLDTGKMEMNSSSRRVTGSRIHSEAEMAFVKKKFLDVGRLSTEGSFHDSREFHVAVDDLESNNDLLLKYLEQPNSLFTKHLHDLRATPTSPHCGRVSVMKSSREPEREGNGLGYNRDTETAWKNFRKNHSDPLGQPYCKYAVEDQLKSQKNESSVTPTRIVVLKPNFGKSQNASAELSSINGEAKTCGNDRFQNDALLPRYKSRESREIAKEITRQMRSSLEDGSLKFSTSGFRGYAGDESSSNRSDNESANELDVPAAISRNASGRINRYRPSPSRSAESSVSREARKRLSERWKITHRSFDMGVGRNSSTLGEMLATPDIEGRPAEKYIGHDRPAGWVEPLGICSRDGWKDEHVRTLSRSKSVPASFTNNGSPRTGMRRETRYNDSYLLKEVTQKPRIKSVKSNFNQREASSSRKSRSHIRRSHFFEDSWSDCSSLSPQKNIREVSTQHHLVSKPSDIVLTDANLISETVVDSTTDREIVGDPSSGEPDVLSSQELSNAAHEEGSVPVQHSAAVLESLESSKEAEQPSPVSVLETPFPDDISSSSECFESLSADLQGLRMQLQLLKLESEAYEEGTMLISSDEEVEEGFLGFYEEEGKVEESREFSYVVDVLLESGISDADPDTFMASCHSSEYPVNSLVFEALEKKHLSLNSWPRSERKLLFDRVNSALQGVYQQLADPHPWVMPTRAMVPKWSNLGLKDGIRKLLANQDKQTTKVEVENDLVTDSEWLESKGDIDAVGRDIERLLIEELLKEIVAV
ncbi:uncharacterized protein LOC126664328 [Mercurialis annua]|uniref:uncharacterized protein LOC126664328 n=1 Tax=Mercurialis annua TaxID=3986 RepID=UPI00216014F6|nr:uncharacterized protein LOC126664328 [Mercurialis annua]